MDWSSAVCVSLILMMGLLDDGLVAQLVRARA